MPAAQKALITLICFLTASTALASSGSETTQLDLTATWLGIISIIIFVFAYVLVIGEEFLHLRKSKPVMVAAGVTRRTIL